MCGYDAIVESKTPMKAKFQNIFQGMEFKIFGSYEAVARRSNGTD